MHGIAYSTREMLLLTRAAGVAYSNCNTYQPGRRTVKDTESAVQSNFIFHITLHNTFQQNNISSYNNYYFFSWKKENLFETLWSQHRRSQMCQVAMKCESNLYAILYALQIHVSIIKHVILLFHASNMSILQKSKTLSYKAL